MSNIGVLHANGRSVPRDYAKALEWYEKGAAAGSSVASRNIGWLYVDGKGVTQDYPKARQWFEKAIAAGDAKARTALADLELRIRKHSAREAEKAGRYAEALRLQEIVAAEIEAEEVASVGKLGLRTTSELGSISWYALFARDYGKALAAADRALGIQADELWIATNRAHALMYLGRSEDARAVYVANKDKPTGSSRKPWQDVIAEDFAELRKAGLAHPQMAEIETALGITAR
jgi:hypothetical protein